MNKLTQEQELANKIIILHESQGLGYRRIAAELCKQGYRTNKDNINRLYLKYKSNENQKQDRNSELAQLRAAELRAKKRVEIQKEKTFLRK
jgi:hypothetical protein